PPSVPPTICKSLCSPRSWPRRFSATPLPILLKKRSAANLCRAAQRFAADRFGRLGGAMGAGRIGRGRLLGEALGDWAMGNFIATNKSNKRANSKNDL